MTSIESRDPWASMLALAAVLAVVLFVYPMTLGIPLLDPDEGLHASIAQEMVEQGDWVVPHFLGEPFLDKPIFYFWAEALSLKLFGMHQWAVRFPGLMFGLLGAVTTAIVGWRMFGRAVGIVAGMFYMTTILPTALAQAAAHDVALIPWINLAVLLFWESDRADTRRKAAGYTLAIGVLLGLTILTKGLTGVALVGVAYGLYVLIARRLTVAACLRGAAALGIAAVVASAWYVAMEIRSPGYLYYYFVDRHLLGYATGTQRHGGKPWWYYLPILIGGGLPWIGYLPVVVQDAWARRNTAAEKPAAGDGVIGNGAIGNGAMLLLWCWLIGCTLFLSTSHSKLVTYIWPVFPAVAILAAVGWVRLIEGSLGDGARRSLGRTFCPSCLMGPAVLPAVLLVVQWKFALRFSWPVWVAAALAAAGAAAPLWFWVRGRYRATISSAMLSTAAQFAVIMTVVLPHVAPTTSAVDLADHFNRLGRVPARLLIAEERIGSLVFYLDRELRDGLHQGRWKLEQVNLAELPGPESGTLIALPQRRVERAGEYVELADVAYERAGRYRLYKATDLPRIARLAKTNDKKAHR